MTEMMFQSSDYRRTLSQSLTDASHTQGAGHLMLEDMELRPLSLGAQAGHARPPLAEGSAKVDVQLVSTESSASSVHGVTRLAPSTPTPSEPAGFLDSIVGPSLSSGRRRPSPAL